MDTAKAAQATYEDLLQTAEDQRAEVLGGELVVSPAPLPRHSRAQGALRRFIGGPFDDDDGFGGPGGWWVLLEVDVRLRPHDIVRPDLCGWRRERLPNPWDVRPIDVTPDWVCEILSPRTAAADRVHKRKLYSTSGVVFYWILDMQARTLETWRLEDGHWVDAGSYGENATARVEPFREVELAVGRLFPPTAWGVSI